jgi:hypothetical protein
MNRSELKKFALMLAVFLAAFFLPVGAARFRTAIFEALALLRWYAREHVLLCLVPAFFIAGGIATFISRASVMRYLGPNAPKPLAYGVASVSGSILAVCSCTVLPLFTGIYRMGAGLGPATAFLYSGPAINVLAIILTASVLGPELGLARAVGAVVFSVVVGLAMHLIFLREERQKADAPRMVLPEDDSEPHRPLWTTAAIFALMIATLVVANWARSSDVRAVFLCCPGGLSTYSVEGEIIERTDEFLVIKDRSGLERQIPSEQIREIREKEKDSIYDWIYYSRWVLVAVLLVLLGVLMYRWYRPPELREWVSSSWGYAKLILPLLLLGVLAAGFLLGRPGTEGIVPSAWVERAVGGNSLRANFFAALAGALMYFATLTEVPILQGLMASGMGKGPALALLLAGPAVSLPNMLVIAGVMGVRKTLVFVALVVLMATGTGMLYGTFF